MVTRLAVTGVGHWHALKDAAYLTHLPALPDVALVALHDPEPGRAAAAAAALLTATGGALRTVTRTVQATAPDSAAEPPVRTLLRDTIARWRSRTKPMRWQRPDKDIIGDRADIDRKEIRYSGRCFR